jgi:hypothetical protein
VQPDPENPLAVDFPDAVLSVSLSLGSATFGGVSEGSYIRLGGEPEYAYQGYNVEGGPAGDLGVFQIGFYSEQGGLFSGLGLPLEPPPIGPGIDTSFTFNLPTDNIDGTITSLFVIPEPSTCAMLALGIAIAATLRRPLDH